MLEHSQRLKASLFLFNLNKFKFDCEVIVAQIIIAREAEMVLAVARAFGVASPLVIFTLFVHGALFFVACSQSTRRG